VRTNGEVGYWGRENCAMCLVRRGSHEKKPNAPIWQTDKAGGGKKEKNRLIDKTILLSGRRKLDGLYTIALSQWIKRSDLSISAQSKAAAALRKRERKARLTPIVKRNRRGGGKGVTGK